MLYRTDLEIKQKNKNSQIGIPVGPFYITGCGLYSVHETKSQILTVRQRPNKLTLYVTWLSTNSDIDRFPKRAPGAQVCKFISYKFPFLGFWVIQTRYWPVLFSPDKVLQIGCSFQYPYCRAFEARRVQKILGISALKVFLLLLKNNLLWKIWPISVKRWKPEWIRPCTLQKEWCCLLYVGLWTNSKNKLRNTFPPTVLLSLSQAWNRSV